MEVFIEQEQKKKKKVLIFVKEGILENYGWQEEEDEDDGNALPKVGPFSIHSWAMYMKDN